MFALLGIGELRRWSVSMRHTGDGFGVAPTGKVVQATGITVMRIAKDKFIDGRHNWDMLGLMQQIQGAGLGPTCVAAKA